MEMNFVYQKYKISVVIFTTDKYRFYYIQFSSCNEISILHKQTYNFTKLKEQFFNFLPIFYYISEAIL